MSAPLTASRDTTDLLVIARDLEEAGAVLRSLAEPLIDTTSDFKELILAIFGIAAKLERRRIIDRTARGRNDAKAKGVKFGRKPKLTPHEMAERPFIGLSLKISNGRFRPISGGSSRAPSARLHSFGLSRDSAPAPQFRSNRLPC